MTRTICRGRAAAFYWAIFAPALAIMLFLTVYPIITVFLTSFQDYDFVTDIRNWNGGANYADILTDELFLRSFSNTVVYSLVTTIFEVALGVVLALVFYGHFRGKTLFMILTILPMMLSTMVVSAVWKTLYHYDIGLLNHLLAAAGFQRVGWLVDPAIALQSLMAVDIWQWTPFAFIVMQAGLASIPQDIFEASYMDGASYSQTLFRVTLPILFDQIMLLCLLRTIDTFKVFAKVFALTRGGPGNSTETTSFFIYREAFQYFKLGRSSAASMLTMIAVAIVCAVYLRKILGNTEV